MKQWLFVGSLGLVVIAACSSGDVEVDPVDGDDDTLPGGGFDASTTRRPDGGARDASVQDADEPEADGSVEPHPDASHDAASDSGGPCTCNAPPETACDGQNRVTYGAGTCVDGGCSYPPTVQPCEFGCSGATCAAADFSYLGGTQAFITGGAQIMLATTSNGTVPTVPSNATISVITQTFAPGTIDEIHVFYDVDPAFPNTVDLPMTFDKRVNANDQFYAVLPAQPASTHVYFYVTATSYSDVTKTDPGNFVNFTYQVQP